VGILQDTLLAVAPSRSKERDWKYYTVPYQVACATDVVELSHKMSSVEALDTSSFGEDLSLSRHIVPIDSHILLRFVAFMIHNQFLQFARGTNRSKQFWIEINPGVTSGAVQNSLPARTIVISLHLLPILGPT
jgi:hypothetical protein